MLRLRVARPLLLPFHHHLPSHPTADQFPLKPKLHPSPHCLPAPHLISPFPRSPLHPPSKTVALITTPPSFPLSVHLQHHPLLLPLTPHHTRQLLLLQMTACLPLLCTTNALQALLLLASPPIRRHVSWPCVCPPLKSPALLSRYIWPMRSKWPFPPVVCTENLPLLCLPK